MRESIGLSTLFKAILVFTLLFAAFIAVAITYNKVFKLKNEVLNIAEKYEGLNNQSIRIINRYLSNNLYNTKGKCNSDEYGVKDLNSEVYERANRDSYLYCIKSEVRSGRVYYNIRLFFKFNLPFLGDLFTFSVNGETKGIKYYDTSQKLS